MTTVDLAFAVSTRDTLPADHGYALYGAVAGVVPAVHADEGVGIHPIRGRILPPRRLALQPWSRLVLRVPADRIAQWLPLAGRQLRIADASLRVGIPEIRPLVPATALRSRLVTIRNGHDPDRFDRELRRKLAAFGLGDELTIVDVGQPDPTGTAPRPGISAPDEEPLPAAVPLAVGTAPLVARGRRRTLRIRDKHVVGYEVLVEGLAAPQSLALQENRPLDPALRFARTHMGCGLFVPLATRRESR